MIPRIFFPLLLAGLICCRPMAAENPLLVLEGHLHQYGQLRTTLTDLAREGAYHRDFITMSDWFHTGEGMRGFMFQGLSEPGSARLRERMKRFAGLYMNEDPEAPNYDPEHRIIRSIWMELHHLRRGNRADRPPEHLMRRAVGRVSATPTS